MLHWLRSFSCSLSRNFARHKLHKILHTVICPKQILQFSFIATLCSADRNKNFVRHAQFRRFQSMLHWQYILQRRDRTLTCLKQIPVKFQETFLSKTMQQCCLSPVIEKTSCDSQIWKCKFDKLKASLA